jgi:hypothetical protein
MSDTRSALEAAMAADPDDAAVLSALADFYLEAGDPRGEYLRLALAARSADAPPAERERLTDAADRVWADHWVGWLGPLAAFAEDLLPLDWHFCWVRGVQTAVLTPAFLAAAATSPLLTALVVRPDDPADVGDDGVDRLVRSGLIDRLTSLELINCGITDDGAAALAACPAVARLKALRLGDNLLSPMGLYALDQVGHSDVGPQQFVPGPFDPDPFDRPENRY